MDECQKLLLRRDFSSARASGEDTTGVSPRSFISNSKKDIPRPFQIFGQLILALSQTGGKNSLKLLKGEISQIVRKIKGVERDPLLYLKIISVFLFGGICFLPPFFLKFPIDQQDCPFVSAISRAFETLETENKNQLLFVGPTVEARQSPDLYLVQKTSLRGISPTFVVTAQVLGSLVDDISALETRKEIIEYTIQEGDTLNSIAENFGISLDTLLWANDLSKNSKIRAGQRLIVLPVSGLIHEVKKGDTLTGIAKRYKAEQANIIAFNGLVDEEDVFVGDILTIPDGIMPAPAEYTPPPTSLTPLASSYFICPISSPCKITQGLHWPNAIDFSHGKCGESIFAAAGGQVTRVRYGYNNGAGNYIQILHPNGVVTTYGHILTSFVNPGDQVSQGQIIALMDGQPGTPGAGISTGCHLHFAVSGARNPFAP